MQRGGSDSDDMGNTGCSSTAHPIPEWNRSTAAQRTRFQKETGFRAAARTGVLSTASKVTCHKNHMSTGHKKKMGSQGTICKHPLVPLTETDFKDLIKNKSRKGVPVANFYMFMSNIVDTCTYSSAKETTFSISHAISPQPIFWVFGITAVFFSLNLAFFVARWGCSSHWYRLLLLLSLLMLFAFNYQYFAAAF